MGTKQNVNHSQRFITCEGDFVSGVDGGREERRTRPEKFPQFWHCTVMCSAPESAELKTTGACLLAMPFLGSTENKEPGVPCVPHVKKKNMVSVVGCAGARSCLCSAR